MFFKIVEPASVTIVGGYEAESPVQHGGPWGQYPHVAVPAEMDAECVRAISWQETVVVEDEPARTIPAEGSFEMQEVVVPESTDPVTGDVIPAYTELRQVWVETKPEEQIPAVTHEEQVTRYGLELDPALVAAKALQGKQGRIAAAAKRMWDDILAQMQVVYGTSDMNSATAYYLTWQDQVAAPEAYVGDLFPSANAVSIYASGKLSEARAYAIFRISRIRQYGAEKAAILAE